MATAPKVWQRVATVLVRQFCIGLLTAALMGAAGTALARNAGGEQVHVVYTGQRLGSIAKRYNVSIEAICEANGISRRDPIHPGQRLRIPSKHEQKKSKADVDGAAPKSATPAKGAIADKASKVSATTATNASPNAPQNKALDTKSAAPAKATQAQPERKTNDLRPPSLAKVSAVASAKPEPVQTAQEPLFGSVSHRIKRGESLSAIAVHYDTSVKALLQVNNLRKDQVIREGQVLTIPKAAPNGAWWAKFARTPRQRGEVEVFAHTNRWKGKVVVNGKVQPAGRAALSRLLGATGSAPPLPERLIQLLAHVSDTFGGRPIRLVSGYRTNSYVKDSRHRHSSAVDFSIQGVPNSAVRDYLLQLGNVGVGYYPNSTFVHLDVRARSAYWVDYAGPGEAPRKQPRPDRRFARNVKQPQPSAKAPSRLNGKASVNRVGAKNVGSSGGAPRGTSSNLTSRRGVSNTATGGGASTLTTSGVAPSATSNTTGSVSVSKSTPAIAQLSDLDATATN